jgi:rhodanese-related sulfurtransferase
MGLTDVAIEDVTVDAWRFRSASLLIDGRRIDGARFGAVPPTPAGGVSGSLVAVGSLHPLSPGVGQDRGVHPHQLPTTAPAELDQARADGAVVLDVREDEEWDAGHLPDSVHIPMHAVPAWLDARAADDERPVVVVCRSGHRSAHVTEWLVSQGVDASNLDGGLLAWAVERRPMVTDSGAEPFVG